MYRAAPLRRWSARRTLMAVSGCLVTYLFLSSGYHNFHQDDVIRNANPEEVWKFVTDVNKMQNVTPNTFDYDITDDSGNTHDWRFSATYKDQLVYWPYWVNSASADYRVTKSMPGVHPLLLKVTSLHHSCFFGMYCLHSEVDFTFTDSGYDTFCMQNVRYQCLPFMARTCIRDVEDYRKAATQKLIYLWSNTRQIDD